MRHSVRWFHSSAIAAAALALSACADSAGDLTGVSASGPDAARAPIVQDCPDKPGKCVAFEVYAADFEGAVGSEWSNSKVSVTPVGSRRFLGDFVNDEVTLDLSGLPPHRTITVSFDLFIRGTMDGYGEYGPEIFSFGADGEAALTTVFSIFNEQAFPGQHPSDRYPALTGASETFSLGYMWDGGEEWGLVPHDAVFPVTYSLPHTARSATISFAASELQPYGDASGGPDESWGIDNVRVRVSPR